MEATDLPSAAVPLFCGVVFLLLVLPAVSEQALSLLWVLAISRFGTCRVQLTAFADHGAFRYGSAAAYAFICIFTRIIYHVRNLF